jgi:photosystem II stability/assembly factor-like uncharacterized protein
MLRVLVLLLLWPASACGQSLQVLSTPSKSSLRGISVADSKTIWISGDMGAVLRSSDGGATWTNVGPPNASDLDFRNIQGFDANVAYAMSSGPGTRSRIFKTTDGGKTWKQQFITFDPKYFFDCFAFWNRDHGIAIGDPVGHHFSMLETHDGGAHWTVITNLPEILPTEAAFSTGSCIVTSGENDIWFGTGSKQGARVFHSADHGRTWSAVATPITADAKAMGIFSIAFANPLVGIIVGGNYQKPEQVRVNAAYTVNGGRTWMATSRQPSGYRCGVAFRPGTDGKTIVTVGTTGVDLSEDRGAHWRSLASERYHSVAFTPDGAAAYILGQNGRVARIDFKTPQTKR